jgi:uncharacterized membrane protein
MKNSKKMVAIYESHEKAENAISTLKKSGFEMQQLSIIGKDYHTEENVVGYYNLGDRMKLWGSTGAFWGSVWGLLFGSAFFIIPGVGPLIIAGPIVAAMVGALEGAIALGGLSVLGAALFSIGIPNDTILECETEIKAGKFMLLAHGSEDEIEKAKEVLGFGEKVHS